MMDLRQLIALLTYLLNNVVNYQTEGNRFVTVLEDWVRGFKRMKISMFIRLRICLVRVWFGEIELLEFGILL